MRPSAAALALFVAGAAFGGEPPDALELVGEARTVAGRENKAILLHFGASWCVWCRRLEAFLQHAKIKPLLESRFVIVRLDVQEHGAKKALENPNGLSLLKDLGGEDHGLPFLALLEAGGQPLVTSRPPGEGAQNIGYPVAPDEIAWFIQMLRKGAPAISEADVQTIAAELRAAASP